MEKLLEEVRTAIVLGDIDGTKIALQNALDNKIDALFLLSDGVGKSMEIVGEKWNAREYFLPDVLASVEAVKIGSEYLKPFLDMSGEKIGTVVIGSVKGDNHNIGKNLVASFMELGGFTVYDLGEDVPAEKFVKAAIEHKADIIGASAFVSTVAEEIKRIVAMLEEKGIRKSTYIMVGGCVLDAQWADIVGADVYTEDAVRAVAVAKEHMGASNN
ncbi:MAG: cobalamin-dependent protein [Synergistaceae bacterium]|nr:cobalamin-dependent protein [Synergistaceae bacterium]